jgi:uncharacterized protein
MAIKNQFTLEITTTALCNLDCTYCFEGLKTDKQKLDEKVDVLKLRIQELLDSEWFNDKYDELNLSFWGGEPTLNFKLVTEIIQAYQDNPKVSYHIYTNAYDRNRLNKIIDNVDTSNLHIQVSYDGKDINDVFRVLKTGKTTSDKVVENIKYLSDRGISTSMKATMPLTAMGSLYSSWKDHERLYKELPNVRVAYAPTIDYVSDIDINGLPDLIDSFKHGMMKIAKEEIEFHKEHGHFLCTWFTENDAKTHCSSGVNMHAIDVDGNSYACHGSLYSPNKDEMKGGHIDDDSFINNIIKMSDSLREPIQEVSDICNGCVATTCMICPVISLDNSKKDNFNDKWTDRWVNNMCGFFKAFGEIDRSVQYYINKRN